MRDKPFALIMSSLLCFAISLTLIAFTIPGWFIWKDFKPFWSQRHLYFYDYFSLLDLITQNTDMINDSIDNSVADFKKGEYVTSLSWWATNTQQLLDDRSQTYFLDLYDFREEFCFCQGCDVIRNYDGGYDDFCLAVNQWVAGSVIVSFFIQTAVLTCLFLVFACISMFMPIIHVKQSLNNAQFPCKQLIADGLFVHVALFWMTCAFIIYTTVLYTIEYKMEMDQVVSIAGAAVYEGGFAATWIAYIFYCLAYRPHFKGKPLGEKNTETQPNEEQPQNKKF